MRPFEKQQSLGGKTMLNVNRIFLNMLLFVFLAVSNNAYAVLFLASGKYSFQIDVYNKLFQNVMWDAQGRVAINGNIARIDVDAKGYRSNHIDIQLKKNIRAYKSHIVLEDPTILLGLEDENSSSIATCTWHIGGTLHLYWGDELGFSGVFPKTGFEKLTKQDFDVILNGDNQISNRVYLTSIGDNWHFEIVIMRSKLDSVGDNHLTVVINSASRETVLPATYFYDLALDYTRNLELASSLRSEREVFLIQCRLESNANELIDAFSGMNKDDQKEILSRLPAEGDLVRSLRSIATFSELHR